MVNVYFDAGNEERCCICRVDTEYWTKTNTALCDKCARVATLKDIPTHEQWVRREQIAEGDAPMGFSIENLE